MPPILMLISCVALVIMLLRIERKGNPTASFALWIPTLYMLILGSRPLGRWFNIGSADVEAGSPLDLLILLILLLFSIVILLRRKPAWPAILSDNKALILLMLFAGISVLWSDLMFLSFKRWFRLIISIPIALVVISEKEPLEALESVFRRCAYVLIPFSIVLIKYYPYLGVSYSRWSGMLAWTGVTLTKNALGHLCLMSSFFILWEFYKNRPIRSSISKTKSRTLADLLILALGVYMLFGGPGGFSATSTTNFFVALCSLTILYTMRNKAGKVANFLISANVLIWILLVFSESFVSTSTSLVGRDATFTDRTDIWAMAIRDAALNPILGTGFGAYFATNNEFSNTFGYTGHNGLLDVYVELGIVGALVLLGFLVCFYRRVLSVFRQSFDWGVFATCFLGLTLLASFTESIFLKSSSYIWCSMIFLTIVLAVLRIDANNSASTHQKQLASS